MTPPTMPATADTTYLLLAILALALCSVISRAGYLLFGDYLPLPDRVRRALRFAPVAALVGIIVPELLPWHPVTGPSVDLRVPAALAAIAVLLATRSAMLTIAGGMLALWGMRWLFG